MATMQETQTDQPTIEQFVFLEHPDVDAEQFLDGQQETIELLSVQVAAYLGNHTEIAAAMERMPERELENLFDGLAVYMYNFYGRGVQVGMVKQCEIFSKQGFERAARQKEGHRVSKLGRQASTAIGAQAATKAKAHKAEAHRLLDELSRIPMKFIQRAQKERNR